MIIQCENCGAKFKLDESLLKEEGSKVRCSSCKKVFLAYPPEEEPDDIQVPTAAQEGVEETVILDSPPDLGGMDDDLSALDSSLAADQEPDEMRDDLGDDLDLAFDADLEEELPGVEEMDEIETLSPEDIPGEDEMPADLDEAFERASRIKGEVTREDAESKAQEEVPSAPEEGPQKEEKGKRRSRFVPAALGLLLLFALVYAALLFLSPGLLPDSLNIMKSGTEETEGDPGVRRLSFTGVKGAFVRTEDGKQRFVIRGVVVNQYSVPRSFILIKATILDGKGQAVTTRKVYAGNPFSQGELVGRPMDFLEKRMDRREGKKKQNIGIASEASVPFMVIFQNLPEDISEFTVEAVSSSPGGKAAG